MRKYFVRASAYSLMDFVRVMEIVFTLIHAILLDIYAPDTRSRLTMLTSFVRIALVVEY